jgi:polyisoprenoid-binding protein YceI
MIGLLLGIQAVLAAEPVRYDFQPERSHLSVVVRYDRDRWTPITAHDHAIVASQFTGSMVWNADDPAPCDVRFELPVRSLVVDPPGARERAGLDPRGTIDDDDKASVVKNMCSASNLGCDRYATIRYQSASCTRTGDRYAVVGDLTIRGSTQRVTTMMDVVAQESGARAQGKLRFTHRDFGMVPFTYGPGLPKNADTLELYIDVTGVPRR